MADAADLKSAAREGIRVRVPAPAPVSPHETGLSRWAHPAHRFGTHDPIALADIARKDELVIDTSGGTVDREGGRSKMWTEMVERADVVRNLAAARRRASALMPYSPAWDAAMAIVEDLERVLWRVDHPDHARLDLGRADSPLLQVFATSKR